MRNRKGPTPWTPDPNRRVTLLVAIAALTCAALWAGQSVAVKLSLKQLTPCTVPFLRAVLSGVFFGIWAGYTRQSLRIKRADLGFIALSAALLYTGIWLYTDGTDQTTAIRSILLVNSYPFFAAIAWYSCFRRALISVTRRRVASDGRDSTAPT